MSDYEIVSLAPGEWTVLVMGEDGQPVRRFGPYYSRDAAKRCVEQHKAFVLNAPVCHH